MKKYKIYKIVFDDQITYIGSTTRTLSSRLNEHIYRDRIPNIKSSSIFLIKETYDKKEEDFWIDYFRGVGCCLYNKKKSVRTKEEYDEYIKSKHRKDLYKKWRKDNADYIKSYMSDYHKSYYIENKEKIREYHKRYYLKQKNKSDA